MAKMPQGAFAGRGGPRLAIIAVAALVGTIGLAATAFADDGDPLPPNVPTAAGPGEGSFFTCDGTTHVYGSQIRLTGEGIDPNDPPLPLQLTFAPAASSGQGDPITPATVNANSGQLAGTSFDLADGSYSYVVTAQNSAGLAAPSASAPVSFTVDTQPPSGTPTIHSFDYPPSAWGAPAGLGSFTLNDGGSTDAAGFVYDFDGGPFLSPPSSCAESGSSGDAGWVPDVDHSATLPTPVGLSTGPHTLVVRTYDRAHNLSTDSTSYSFLVSPRFLPDQGSGRIEAESLAVTAQPAVIDNPPATKVGTATVARETSTLAGWSGNAQLRLRATTGFAFNARKPLQHGAQFVFPITAPVEADYALGAQFSTSNHYGLAQFSVVDASGKSTTFVGYDGRPITFDGYSPTAGSSYRLFGGAHLKPGRYSLVMTIVGKDPQSVTGSAGDNGYGEGVDFLTVLPINNVRYPSFSAALNNNGIAATGQAGDIDYSGVHRALSATTMQLTGWAPGSTVRLDGVPFRLSAENGVNDNVVAVGQAIPLSSRLGAQWLDLLVLATGGGTPSGFLQLNYTDPELTSSNAELPPVPDWLGPPKSSSDDFSGWRVSPGRPATTIPVLADGKPTGKRAVVYHVRIAIPFGADHQVTSVVLPSYGTTFAPGATALHVLAITTSA